MSGMIDHQGGRIQPTNSTSLVVREPQIIPAFLDFAEHQSFHLIWFLCSHQNLFIKQFTGKTLQSIHFIKFTEHAFPLRLKANIQSRAHTSLSSGNNKTLLIKKKQKRTETLPCVLNVSTQLNKRIIKYLLNSLRLL